MLYPSKTKPIILCDPLYTKSGSGHDFKMQVKIFHLHFLSSLWSKYTGLYISLYAVWRACIQIHELASSYIVLHAKIFFFSKSASIMVKFKEKKIIQCISCYWTLWAKWAGRVIPNLYYLQLVHQKYQKNHNFWRSRERGLTNGYGNSSIYCISAINWKFLILCTKGA